MILTKGRRAVDPERGIDEVQDMVLDGGMIKCVGDTGSPDLAGQGEEYERVIDTTGLVVAPGLVDVHVHSRDPGLAYKEDIGTGTKMTAADGFTTVVCMANTKPPVDNVKTLSYVIEEGKKTDVHALAGTIVSVGMRGQELTDVAALKAAGAAGLTNDGIPMMNGQLVLEAMEGTTRLGVPLSFHEEDPVFIRNNGINHRAVSEKMGTYGFPSVAKDTLVTRDYVITLHTEASVNIQHISSHHTVEVVRHTKAMGASVVAEVTPHHFMLIEEAVLEHGILAKMNPPLRTEEDRQTLIQGLKDGTINIITTDRAPCSQEERTKPLAETPSGIIGLGTTLALGITELATKGYLTMLELTKKINPNSAKLHRLPHGRLRRGAAANLVIFDEKELWTVENGYSRSTNSPLTGRQP